MSDPSPEVAPDFRVPVIVKSAASTSRPMEAMAQEIFDAVKVFVDRRIDKSEAGLADTVKQIESVLERVSPADTVRRLDVMRQHLSRLESRIQLLEKR